MKPDIHPDVRRDARSTCTCGTTFTTRSTAKNGVIHAEVCSQCHPFYTGKQKILDTGGRVARFEKRFGTQQVRDSVAAHRRRRRLAAGRPSRVARRRRRLGPATGPLVQRPPVGESCDRCSEAPADELLAEYADLERQLADPAVHADQARRAHARHGATPS